MNENKDLSKKILADVSKMLSKSIHDINNPFAVLMGQVSILEILLKKEELNLEKINGSIQKMKTGMEKMRNRMDSLRGFYRIPLNDSAYTGWPAIKHAIDYVARAQDDTELELTVEEDCPFPCDVTDSFLIIYHYQICCDPSKLIQIDVTAGEGSIHIRGVALTENVQKDPALIALLKKYNSKVTKSGEHISIAIPV